MKVALIGSASTSVAQAPWSDESWELWGMPWNMGPAKRPYSVFFEMHDMERADKKDPAYRKMLASLAPKPIYMIEPLPEVPSAVRFPMEECVRRFGDYFTSSIAYMIGLFLLKAQEAKAKEPDTPPGTHKLGIWGVDMLHDSEYAIQRPCLEWLLGLAVGQGLDVTIPDNSALLKANFRYGFGDPQGVVGLTEDWLRNKLKEFETKRDQARNAANTYDGVCQILNTQIDYVRHFNRGGRMPC